MRSRHTFLIRVALAGAAAWLAAAPASAQIYTWRDASGNLVLSDKRPTHGTTVTSYAVPQAESIRTTGTGPIATQRVTAYDDLIVEHARRHNVRQSLVRAVIQVESAFNPYARSPKGAMGLMQLMPATALQFGVRNAYDPAQNVGAGVAYLRQLLDRYDDNEELALAAYNAGPGAVDKHGQSVPPYRETAQYVSKINRLSGGSTPAAPGTVRAAGTTLYRTVDLVDGREIIKYTDRKPE